MSKPALSRPRLDGVDTWIFDLDNTLYPPRCNLFSQVDARMCQFIQDFLGVETAEARKLQKDYYVEHGTTLAGLMHVHGMQPEAFLAYVHDIDLQHIQPDVALGAALAALPGRKLVFTNGSKTHAENVTAKLGLEAHFDGLFGIETAAYVPKPAQAAYEKLVETSNIDPKRAAMVEDMARNLVAPHAMGMATVWVRPGEPGPERHQQLAHDGADGPHVHHITEDLAGFLTGF